jgi:hypothetical protein
MRDIVKQQNLFNEIIKEDWETEWQNMPEFKCDDFQPIKQLLINFKTEEDVKEFAKLLNQKITLKTKSIHFPKKEKSDKTLGIYINGE